MDPFAPYDWLATFFVARMLGLPAQSPLANSLHFFIYDTLKIFTLLFGISFTVTFVRSYFSAEKTRAILSHKRWAGLGNALAALLGIVTPFCSCSAVTLFMGFVTAGVPLGVTFSFLVAAPMINEVALILLWSLFGFQVAALYVAAGLVLAIAAGWMIGVLRLERFIEPELLAIPMQSAEASVPMTQVSLRERVGAAWDYSLEIQRKVWLYVLAGIGIGAWMHNALPADWMALHAGRDNPLAVPLAVLLGVPMYANAAGALPIAEVLVDRGLPVGTVLAFTMAVTALSFPEMILLRRVLRWPLLGIFVAILTVGIIAWGYLFNAMIP